LQHRSRTVAVGGMSDLVRNDAGEFIGRLGLIDETLEDIDVSAG
jgi:hypothetical protein